MLPLCACLPDRQVFASFHFAASLRENSVFRLDKSSLTIASRNSCLSLNQLAGMASLRYVSLPNAKMLCCVYASFTRWRNFFIPLYAAALRLPAGQASLRFVSLRCVFARKFCISLLHYVWLRCATSFISMFSPVEIHTIKKGIEWFRYP